MLTTESAYKKQLYRATHNTIQGIHTMTDETDFTPLSLDTTLDDIEDLPAFAVFPSGAYHIILMKGLELKKINEHQAITAEMTLEESMEIDPKMLNKGEEGPKKGDISTLSFMLDNKWGAGNLKIFTAPLAESFAVKTLREVVENSTGAHLMVVLQRTFDKDAGKHYQRCVKVAVL